MRHLQQYFFRHTCRFRFLLVVLDFFSLVLQKYRSDTARRVLH